MEDTDRAIMHLEEEVKEIQIQIKKILKRPDVHFKEHWMDGQDVMLALHISPRTLRKLRAKGILTAARLLNKHYYKVSDIEKLLAKNYNRNHNLSPHD